MEFLNDIYKKNQLFYWHNTIGEVNMPGDGEGYSYHSADELPPLCRELYDKYIPDDGECWKYVVSFKGSTGLLLVTLYSEYEISETCGIRPEEKRDNEEKVQILMEIVSFILKQRIMRMEGNSVFDDCTLIFGDYTDPVGHEVALFVPKSKLEQLPELEKNFLQECWNPDDKDKLVKVAKVLLSKDKPVK